MGLHSQGQTQEWTVRRGVRRILPHKDFSSTTYDNDIALMELDADVTLNQYIWPICLPSPAHDFPAGQEAWITGWGATHDGGEAEQTHGSESPLTRKKKFKQEVSYYKWIKFWLKTP